MDELSRVSFVVLSKDKAQKECWTFYRLRMTLVVDEYRKLVKEPGKRAWRPSGLWSRLNGRYNTMTRDQVPLDNTVMATARRELLQLAEAVSVGFQD